MVIVARGRYSFWLRAALVAALVIIADRSLWAMTPAAGLAGPMIAAVAALAIASPAARRHGWLFLLTAAILAGLQLETASGLGVLLWAVALGIAALVPRAGFAEGAWTWAQRLIVMATGVVRAPAKLLVQLGLKRVRARPGVSFARLAGLIGLPLVGGLVFLALFAAANPLLRDLLGALRGPQVGFLQVVLWIVVGFAALGLLRPVHLRRPIRLPAARADARMPGVNAASVTLSLITFNLLFAVQNGLDIAFLWSGARLPLQHTLAEYAHRGAYPLIVTALLAGVFVLATLAPGSETSRRPLVRWLVAAWVGQNVLLVVFSIQRTLLYIDSFDLTRLRIAALAWMGLVAVGLILIAWRLLAGKTAAWLINRNAAAAGAVLLVFALGDSGAVAADWNLRHAREMDGTGAALDAAYIRRLGPSALVALTRLEEGDVPPAYRRQITALRRDAMAATRRQSSWGWTWRNQRRLDQAEAALASRPDLRNWSPPPEVAPPPAAPSSTPPAQEPRP